MFSIYSTVKKARQLIAKEKKAAQLGPNETSALLDKEDKEAS